jgi:hypothetical protein
MKCPFCQRDLKWVMTEGRKIDKEHVIPPLFSPKPKHMFIERLVCQNPECRMIAIELKMKE